MLHVIAACRHTIGSLNKIRAPGCIVYDKNNYNNAPVPDAPI